MAKQKQTPSKAAAAAKPPARKRAEKVQGGDDVHVRVTEQSSRGGQVEGVAGEGGRYVYGVIAARDPLHFGRMGIGGGGDMVYTINYGDIAAVVSNTSVYIFDPTR